MRGQLLILLVKGASKMEGNMMEKIVIEEVTLTDEEMKIVNELEDFVASGGAGVAIVCFCKD